MKAPQHLTRSPEQRVLERVANFLDSWEENPKLPQGEEMPISVISIRKEARAALLAAGYTDE